MKLIGALPLLALGLVACGGGGQSEPAATAEPEAPAAAEAVVEEAPKVEGDALAAMLADENIFLLDVRNPEELEELGTVDGYVNIPIDQLADRLDEIPEGRRILTA